MHVHLYIKGTVQRCPKLGGEENSATDGRKFIHDSRSRQNCAGDSLRSVSHAGIHKSINFLSDTFELSTVKMLPSTQLTERLQDQGVQKKVTVENQSAVPSMMQRYLAIAVCNLSAPWRQQDLKPDTMSNLKVDTANA